MKLMIKLVILISCGGLQLCEAATFKDKKAVIIQELNDRIQKDIIDKGIAGARGGTNYFHNRACKIGVSITDWITIINQFANDYPKNSEANLLEIVAWFNDCTIADVKNNYGITP